MTPTKQDRKAARTRIYRALYGSGSNTYNIPWLDHRILPQDWDRDLSDMIVTNNWSDARFDKTRARIIVERAFTLGIKLEVA